MQDKVMTIIANPAIKKLDIATIDSIKTLLQDAGVTSQNGNWLAFEEAYDLPITGNISDDIYMDIIKAPQMQSYDIVFQSTKNRRKKMLIADMDSTMITIECIDELADFAGIKEHVAAITERAMNGELDFKAALLERVTLLKGLDESVLQRAYDERVQFMPGGKELLATMKKNGSNAVLVSGGFTYFTSRVAGALGFDEQSANVLDIANGVLTGRVIEPILDKEAKLENLYYYADKFGITADDVIAVGDGANDLPMLSAAGMGVAYHAKPNVQAHIKTHINYANLIALLYIQGYQKEEIVMS